MTALILLSLSAPDAVLAALVSALEAHGFVVAPRGCGLGAEGVSYLAGPTDLPAPMSRSLGEDSHGRGEHCACRNAASPLPGEPSGRGGVPPSVAPAEGQCHHPRRCREAVGPAVPAVAQTPRV